MKNPEDPFGTLNLVSLVIHTPDLIKTMNSVKYSLGDIKTIYNLSDYSGKIKEGIVNIPIRTVLIEELANGHAFAPGSLLISVVENSKPGIVYPGLEDITLVDSLKGNLAVRSYISGSRGILWNLKYNELSNLIRFYHQWKRTVGTSKHGTINFKPTCDYSEE